MSQRLCAGCGEVRSLESFRLAHPDFPTRDGRVYCCDRCAPPRPVYRVEASAGPFRKIERCDDGCADPKGGV